MLIRFWGARGSIPVCGPQFLKYGGDTACVEIRSRDDQVVIVDAGSGIRQLGKRLLDEGRDKFALIFTHAHLDHVIGFPFLKLIYDKRTRIDLYGCPFAQDSVHKMIARTMSPPTFPVNFADVAASFTDHGYCATDFSVAGLEVKPILLSHPNEGLGYSFEESGKRFIFLTDNELSHVHPGGLGYDEYRRFCEGADFLVHDAEFTEDEYRKTRTWGHSTYTDALRLALEAKVKKLGLFHHNQDRADAEVDRMLDDCHRIVRERGADLEVLAVSSRLEIEL